MNNVQNFSLNKTDWRVWARTAYVFLIPIGILYTTSIVGSIQEPGHLLVLSDFVPNQFVMGGITLYVLNRIQDILRKGLATS